MPVFMPFYSLSVVNFDLHLKFESMRDKDFVFDMHSLVKWHLGQ